MGVVSRRVLALSVAELAAAGIMALAFSEWISVSYSESFASSVPEFSFRGDETESLTGFGDGWLTAALATVILAACFLPRFAPASVYLVGALVAIGGLTVAGVGLFVAMDSWPDFRGRSLPHTESNGLGLQATMALGLVCGAAGLVLLLERQTTMKMQEEEPNWA